MKEGLSLGKTQNSLDRLRVKGILFHLWCFLTFFIVVLFLRNTHETSALATMALNIKVKVSNQRLFLLKNPTESIDERIFRLIFFLILITFLEASIFVEVLCFNSAPRGLEEDTPIKVVVNRI